MRLARRTGMNPCPYGENSPFECKLVLSSANASIVQVYNQANGEVLILGEPGAGKTTLLLELTRALLERARQDESYPIPVVFSLSSWATTRQPLTQWLASELHSRYQVPLPLATSWIETDQVLPLLDGLDEVAAPHRAACVEAINNYRREHGLLPTVVCSRQADYFALPTRLLLRTAVVVQPLTAAQIEAYLMSGGERLEALRETWRKDADLRALANTPLMLNVLTVAYQGTPPQEITTKGLSGMKREQVFASYVQRMLTHRQMSDRYREPQTIHWLRCLAVQMKRQSQSIFYVEQLQPTWLSSKRMLRVYDWLTVRWPDALLGALVGLAFMMFLSIISLPTSILGLLLGGFLGILWSDRRVNRDFVVDQPETTRSVPWTQILKQFATGTLVGLLVAIAVWAMPLPIKPPSFPEYFWLSFGLSFGFSFGLWTILLQRLIHTIKSPGIRHGLLVGLFFVLTSAVAFGLIYGFVYGPFVEIPSVSIYMRIIKLILGILFSMMIGGLVAGLSLGLFLGLNSGLLSALLVGKGTMVQPVDRLVWSWRSLEKQLFSKQHLRRSLTVGLTFGLSSALLFALFSLFLSTPKLNLTNVLSAGLIEGLLIGFAFWLLLGLLQGVSSETIADQQRVIPNQGIHRSAFNGLVLGLISAIVAGLIQVLGTWLSSMLTGGQSAPITGLFAGVFTGLVVCLLNGGLTCLRHYVLRFLLWRTGLAPWRYVQFLDSTAERILLRKVGGGYIFLHRLLLDYFADLETGAGSHVY